MYIDISIIMINVCVCTYICIHVSSEQMMRCVCVCVCCTLDPTEMSPTTIALFAGRKERRKQVCCERGWWWHSSPLRLVSSFSFFLFFWLVCRWKNSLCVALSKVHSSFSSDAYGKSKLPSLCTHAIIIIQCFVQRAKTSLDIYKFNYITTIHSNKIQYHKFLYLRNRKKYG